MNRVKGRKKLKGQPFIFVGGFAAVSSAFDSFVDYTRSYLTVRAIWYTPCAVKYEKWSRFFNIFSVDMWICFALSLVLVVITVSCISDYRHKSHLHESSSYSNIFSDAANIIPYPTAFPYWNGMVLHFYQQQESSTTKTVHKVINKGLKTYV